MHGFRRPIWLAPRPLLLLALLALLALHAGACAKHSPTDPAQTDGGSMLALSGSSLRVADQSGLSRASLQLAQVANTPYQIEWSTFVAGPPLLEALAADALDIGGVGDTPPIFAQAAKWTGSYFPALWVLAPCVLLTGVVAFRVALPGPGPTN